MRVARLFLFADWPEKYFSGQSEGGISNASGTRSVRVSAQGLSRSCCKLSPMKIPSSRLAAPGSPRMGFVVNCTTFCFHACAIAKIWTVFFADSFPVFFLLLFFPFFSLFIFYLLSPSYPLEKFWPQPFKKPGSGTLGGGGGGTPIYNLHRYVPL